MPEIYKISWSLEVLGYLIFFGVFLGKNMLLIFYIPQFGKFPEYAWDTLYIFWCKISGLCMGYSKFYHLENFREYYITFRVKSLEYTLDILENCPDCGTLNIPCIFQRFYTKSYVMYSKHTLDNFPNCGTLNIPCIFQRFYTKSYIMYPKHILGIFQIVEYKILITYSLPEIQENIKYPRIRDQEILNISGITWI